MADMYVKAPDGRVVVIDSADQQRAADSGYTPVDQATIQAAQAAEAPAEAAGGLATGPYSATQAFAEKALSSATFGQFPGLDSPDAVAGGRRFAEEHPYAAMGGEVLGQLPLALATGAAGAAIRAGAAGAGLAARGGALAADVALGAAVGGAQTEAEEVRLSGEEFSYTDAAVAGVAGEVLGRGGVWAVSKAVGGARNLMARAERDLVAKDAAQSLSKGGWLSDYRTAQHAEAYHNELAELAARDLDTLEENFAEVSRQDRKRVRITRAVQDNPVAQAAVRSEAFEGLRGLRDALGDELAESGSAPARKLLKQLDERMEALADGRTGKKLWRTLDENRQALQEYRQDLYQAYENNPGSAWLSREGLAAIDAAEKSTREALLREDVWGEAAARMQREYNTPFHEQYFPTVKTVRSQLMFSPQRNAEGFAVFRGEPGHIRRFLARDAGDPDAHRLAEQFSQYLDGVEAVAKAGQADTPAAARNTLEAVRRLRKAVANAAQISAAAGRTKARTGLVTAGVEAAGAAATAAVAGPGAGALGYAALRGARIGDFLARAGQRLGWGSGEALSMAKLLDRDALPPVAGKDAPLVVDDIMDAAEPPRTPPPSGPPSAPPPGPAPGGGLSPSLRAEAARGSWQPSEVPSGRPTGTDNLSDVAPGELDEITPAPVRPGRETRAALPTRPASRTPATATIEADEALTPGRAARQADARRAEALTQGEFRDVVRQLKASGDEAADELADQLESQLDELVDEGLVDPRAARQAGDLDRQPPSLDEVDQYYAARDPFQSGQNVGTPADAARRTATTAPPVPEAQAAGYQAQRAQQAFQSLGMEVRMGADRLDETLDTVFTPREAPTPEQWRKLIPLDLLEQIAPVAEYNGKRMARVDVLGDSLIWSAEGELSAAAPHTTWDGRPDPGGWEDDAWKISRTFSRDDAGKLEVHHDHFFIRGDLQNSGVGAKVLRSMMDTYRKLGVDVVSVDAVEVGKYFWPSIGFDCSPASLRVAKQTYIEWFTNGRRPGAAIPLSSAEAAEFAARRAEAEAAVAKVRSLPSLAQLEHGKDFLLQQSGPWNSGLRMSLQDENPLYHLMRGRLDIAAAGVLALGGALEGGSKSGDGSDGAAAAAMAPMALFGRRAALFKAARTKVVTDVARRLFSSAAQPAARAAGRVVYNRAELAQRQEEFQAWQSDPQTLVDRVAEGFRDVPPEHAGTVNGGVFRTATFLKERLPTVTKLNAVSLRQIPVSTEALNKYARYEAAALRPRDELQSAAATGHISAELMETLGELYPDLLAELRVQAMLQVQANGPPTTVQARLSYARLFDGRGELADPSMSQTVANMTAYAYEQAVPPTPGKGPTSSGNVSHVAAASAAPRMGLRA